MVWALLQHEKIELNALKNTINDLKKNKKKICEARIWQLNCFIDFNRQYFVNWLLFDPSNTSILFWVRKINFLKRQELSIFKVAA